MTQGLLIGSLARSSVFLLNYRMYSFSIISISTRMPYVYILVERELVPETFPMKESQY